MKRQILNLDDVASICGVSLNRVRRWIEKRGIKVFKLRGGEETVRHEDFIDFLVRYNMPIPPAIIPFNAVKILFIHTKGVCGSGFIKFLVRFMAGVKNEGNYILDHITYGADAKMKIMIFRPDVLILDLTKASREAVTILRLVRENEEFSGTRIIGITEAEAGTGSHRYMRQSGFDALEESTGPITPLLMRIKQWC